ncbi:hypothetical protein, partial [Ruminococcus callidus]
QADGVQSRQTLFVRYCLTDFFGYFHRKCRFSLAKPIFLWYNYDNIIANQHVNQRHCPHITRIP